MLEPLLIGEPSSKKKSMSEEICFLYSKTCSERCTFKDVGWKGLREKSKLWVGLDTFGNVSQTVNWNVGPECHYMYANRKVKLYNSRSSEQAKKRRVRLERPKKVLMKLKM